MIFYPKGYFNKVSEISLEYLKENNIKGLILDVDNTLIDFDLNVIEGLEQWHNEIRKNGVKTKTDSHLSTNNCPNCGAVIEVDDNGVCKYCETSLVSGDTEWVLSDIRNIKISGM